MGRQKVWRWWGRGKRKKKPISFPALLFPPHPVDNELGGFFLFLLFLFLFFQISSQGSPQLSSPENEIGKKEGPREDRERTRRQRGTF